MDAATFEKEFPNLARHLGPENVSRLLELADVKELAAGQVLIEDLSPVDAVHLILTGELRVELKADKETLLLGRFGKGKWVGEVSLFTDDHISTAKVTADTPTTTLSLKHTDFAVAQSRHPAFACALTQIFLELMAQRLRASDQVLEQVGERRLAFQGSDTLKRGEDDAAQQGWLRTVLKKLSGVEG